MNDVPPPPAGFVLEGAPAGDVPPPPPGFQLEQQVAPPIASQQGQWAEPGVLAPIQYQMGPDGKVIGARLAMPQILTDAWNAIQAPGRAMQGQYDQVEISPDGAVSPFDPRMMQDASSLASVVSPMSPASRLGSAVGSSVARAAMPEIDDLYAAKDAAYKAVDSFGARFSGQSIDNLFTDMYRRVGEANIDPSPDGMHKATVRMLERLNTRGGPMSLTALDQLRQEIRRDVIDGGSKGDAFFGKKMIDAIDDFIEKAGPGQISGATGQTADFAIRTARQANTVLRKSETLQEAMEKARLRAAASGSGGNIDNAIRQELTKIITTPKKARAFTAAELKMMEGIVKGGGKLQDTLRLLGKLSPSGNGLMAALGLGATAANPLMAVGPAVGLAAKAASDRVTQRGVENLTRTVRSGNTPALPPAPSPALPRANTMLLEQNMTRPMPSVMPLGNGKFRLSS